MTSPATIDILIAQIEVLNPRGRNRRIHQDIIENIAKVGLKRPIKVSECTTPNASKRYSLVCGQGRLEAYQALGQTHIPALIVSASVERCMIESLVENLARPRHRAIDLMQEIGALRSRGCTDAQIANKTGLGTTSVGDILTLLDKGEARLLAAVETGLIPMRLAADIAKVKDSQIQVTLTEAYETGLIKGSRIGSVRRLLDQRAKDLGQVRPRKLGRKDPGRRLDAQGLLALYEQETIRQRSLIEKADHTHTQLMILVEALKDLRQSPDLIALLEIHDLSTLPRGLAARLEPAQ